MESEFIALGATGREAEWIRNLLLDVKLCPMPPITIYYDSEATLSKTYNSTYNRRSRHIGIRHEFVRQLIKGGVITIVYAKSSKNYANPFTKALSRDLVRMTSYKMGL